MTPKRRRLAVLVGLVLVFSLLLVRLLRNDWPGALFSRRTLPPPPEALAQGVRLVTVGTGFRMPLFLAELPDSSGRLLVVEKPGTVRFLRDGLPVDPPFLDLTEKVSGSSEQGLLGFAFHPKFSERRLVVAHFTDPSGDSRVMAFPVEGDRADLTRARLLLTQKQPFKNHNGGHVAFGPDGKLYIGFGDGGGAGDPHGNGQNPETLLGKLVRLDLDGPESFEGRPTPEVIASGLRNPWRYAFDRVTGDLYIGDVGQDRYEEIDVLRREDLRPHATNFGWNVMEGERCFTGACDKERFALPVVTYEHPDGCSVTGGVVYRGAALPELQGHYFYSDFCGGWIRSFRWTDTEGVTEHVDWRSTLDPDKQVVQVASFAEDALGEVYVLSLDGVIRKLTR